MLMSKAEYARHRGVSRQTVYDWVAKGEVVVSGTKIDVEATERSLQKEEQTPDERHPRVLEMTWGQFWAAVKALDGKSPAPRTEDEIKQRVLHAARELNWTVEFAGDVKPPCIFTMNHFAVDGVPVFITPARVNSIIV
ncbi:TPA: hypothetical protein L9K91_003549 [Klebsiella variicola]|nr:hypothetical protein [Klebsiella variicola]